MKSGFIALIGRPNAGKSTLLNALLQHKIAIISPKAQTTRNAIRGILTNEDSQLIYVDTPGIHKPQHKLGGVLNKTALQESRGVDLIYLLVDATQPFGSGDEYILQHLNNIKMPTFLILNKTDLLSREQVMKMILLYKDKYPFTEIFPLSALKNNDFSTLIEKTTELMPEGPLYYPSDQHTDYPEQFIISEIIREKILYLTKEEVPHSIAVIIERMGRKKDNLLINAMIIVERDSQKGIIIGKQGSMLKEIGQRARIELQEILGSKIYLELFVRVEKNWRNKMSKLNELGLVEIENLDE
ncbi:MAG: GTPase Era [Erysipelotrichaceae bacterium]